VARRSPTLGALIVSLPLVSILGILWLWHDTSDVERITVDILVRAPDAADVPGNAGDVAPRDRILALAHNRLRPYLHPLPRHDPASWKVRRVIVMQRKKT